MRLFFTAILLLGMTCQMVAQTSISDPVPFPKNYFKHPVFQQARAYSKSYDWTNADAYWQEFSLRYPDARPRYFEYGSVKIALGQYEAAKKLLQQGYLANPYDSRTIMEYMTACALTKDNTQGKYLADQLGRVISASDYQYYDGYITQQADRYTGGWAFAGEALRSFHTIFKNSYQSVGPTDRLQPNIKAAVELKASSWEEIMRLTFELKELLSSRGINPGAYHWFIADQYEHVKAVYGQKGAWVYGKLDKEMIKEYETESSINVYYQAKFGKKLYEQYAGYADFDRALTLNSKLIAEVSESGLFRYNLIDLYTSKTFVLYNLGRFQELSNVANSLNQLLDEYKNPTFKANAYETLCAAYAKDPQSAERAIDYGLKALKLIQQNQLGRETAVKSLLSIAYFNKGDLDKGLEYAGLGSESAKSNYISMYNIGSIYGEDGQHEKALEFYRKSLDLYNQSSASFTPQQKVTSRSRLSLLFSEMARSQYLLKQHEGVYETLEDYKASTLASVIGGSTGSKLSLSKLQSMLKPGEVYLNYKMTSQRGFLVTSVDRQGIENHHFDIGSLVQPLKKYFSDGLTKLDRELSNMEYRTGEYVAVDGHAEQASIPINKGDFNLIAELYRKHLTGDLAKYLNLPPNGIKQVSNTMATEFYNHFMAEVPKIQNAKTLYISPDGPLHFIPFESLKNKQGRYLAQDYQIKMIPSATVWSQLRQRSYPASRKEVIAFGGAIYEEAQSSATLVQSIKEINSWQLKSYDLVDRGASLTDLFKAMGYGNMSYLPGTLAEVQEIGKIHEGSKLITGKDMNEKAVKDLSGSGELRNYKVVHFATHGWVINSMPEVSGLAMSIPQVSTDGEDGMLIAREVSKLDLQADMVMLSACQTGLGKLYGGEGVSGLSQSFLKAGANSTIVSLWPVNDYATSILVKELYRIVQTQGVDYASALATVKKNFIDGKYNTSNLDLSKPVYWAPFVYNGI